MSFYIVSNNDGFIVESLYRRPTDEELQQLADEMEIGLYVIEGEHAGMEVEPVIAQPPDVAALVAALQTALAWFDDYYPDKIFTGESGDPGAVRVAGIREQIRAALAGISDGGMNDG